MREIKFRAWDGADMIYFNLELCNRESKAWFDNTIWRNPVMQFTGLHDKNGREIYEGDIIRWDDASNGRFWRVAHVVWDETGTWAYRIIPSACIGCFKDGRGHDFKLGSFIYTPDSTQDGNVLEVIGNVHQTPELLEKNK